MTDGLPLLFRVFSGPLYVALGEKPRQGLGDRNRASSGEAGNLTARGGREEVCSLEYSEIFPGAVAIRNLGRWAGGS